MRRSLSSLSWRARPAARRWSGCSERSCWSCRWPTSSIPFAAWSKALERSNRCSRTSSSSPRIFLASSPACVWAFTRMSTAARRSSSTFPRASGPCRPAAACPGRAAHRPNRRRPRRNGIALETSGGWSERTRSAAGASASTIRQPLARSRGSVSSSSASMRRFIGRTRSRWRRRGPRRTSGSDTRSRTWSRSSIAALGCTGPPKMGSRSRVRSRAWSIRCGSGSALNSRAGTRWARSGGPRPRSRCSGSSRFRRRRSGDSPGGAPASRHPARARPRPRWSPRSNSDRSRSVAADATVILPSLPVTRDSIFVRLKLAQAPARERLGAPLLITLTSPARPRLWLWLRGA